MTPLGELGIWNEELGIKNAKPGLQDLLIAAD
jgi:hypothetical protein